MEHYNVNISEQAFQDLDRIYAYIAHTLLEPATAAGLLDRIEKAILSLEQLPYRCPERARGIYAGKGYRQLLMEHYTIIFRVSEQTKDVIIVTVRHASSHF